MTSEDEKRSKHRFAIERDVRYKIAKRGVPVASGSGHTIDVGSGGVAFIAEQPLAPGMFVELSISWPVLLADTCPMRFVVFGRILRSTGRKTVCTIEKYEFRTQARSFQAAASTRADTMLQRWADEVRKENGKTSAAGA
ncbi:MAG: PilZ domain-containing protein [Candidatus Solibacter sp.]